MHKGPQRFLAGIDISATSSPLPLSAVFVSQFKFRQNAVAHGCENRPLLLVRRILFPFNRSKPSIQTASVIHQMAHDVGHRFTRKWPWAFLFLLNCFARMLERLEGQRQAAVIDETHLSCRDLILERGHWHDHTGELDLRTEPRTRAAQ